MRLSNAGLMLAVACETVSNAGLMLAVACETVSNAGLIRLAVQRTYTQKSATRSQNNQHTRPEPNSACE